MQVSSDHGDPVSLQFALGFPRSDFVERGVPDPSEKLPNPVVRVVRVRKAGFQTVGRGVDLVGNDRQGVQVEFAPASDLTRLLGR